MKARNVIFQREAQEDVTAIAYYIAGDNPEAAERFVAALDTLCKLLIHAPDIGSARIFKNERLRGTRIIPIRKFEKYLVFYRIHGDGGVEILRIIHGARDYPVLFADE